MKRWLKINLLGPLRIVKTLLHYKSYRIGLYTRRPLHRDSFCNSWSGKKIGVTISSFRTPKHIIRPWGAPLNTRVVALSWKMRIDKCQMRALQHCFALPNLWLNSLDLTLCRVITSALAYLRRSRVVPSGQPFSTHNFLLLQSLCAELSEIRSLSKPLCSKCSVSKSLGRILSMARVVRLRKS